MESQISAGRAIAASEPESAVRTGDGMGRGRQTLTPDALRHTAELPGRPITLLLSVCSCPALRHIALVYRACGPGDDWAEMPVA